jgi:hypothetical protein
MADEIEKAVFEIAAKKGPSVKVEEAPSELAEV